MGHWLLNAQRLDSTDTLHTCARRRRRSPSPRSEPVARVHAPDAVTTWLTNTCTHTHAQLPRSERVRRGRSPDVPPVGSAKSAVAFLQRGPTPPSESLDLFDAPADAELMQKKRLAAMQRLLKRSQGRKAKIQRMKLRQRAKNKAATPPPTFRGAATRHSPQQPASPRNSPRGRLDRAREKPWDHPLAKAKETRRVGESSRAMRELRRQQLRRDALAALKARRRETQVARQRLEGRSVIKMEFDFNGGSAARVTRARAKPVGPSACAFVYISETIQHAPYPCNCRSPDSDLRNALPSK